MSSSTLPKAYQNLPLSDRDKTRLASSFASFSTTFTLAYRLLSKTFISVTLPFYLSVGGLVAVLSLVGFGLFDLVAGDRGGIAFLALFLYGLFVVFPALIFVGVWRVNYLRNLAGQAVFLWSLANGESWRRLGVSIIVNIGLSFLISLGAFLVTLPFLFWQGAALANLAESIEVGVQIILNLSLYGAIGIFALLIPVEGAGFDTALPLAYRSSVPYFWQNTLRWLWFSLLLGFGFGLMVLVASVFGMVFALVTILLPNILGSALSLVFLALIYGIGLIALTVLYDAFHLIATANLRALYENRTNKLDN